MFCKPILVILCHDHSKKKYFSLNGLYLSSAPYSERIQHRHFTQTNFPIFNTKPKANYIAHNTDVQYRHDKGKMKAMFRCLSFADY